MRSVTIAWVLLLSAVRGYCQDTVSCLIKTDLISYFPSLVLHTGKLNIELELPQPEEKSYVLGLAYITSYGSSRPSGYLPFPVEQRNTSGFLLGGEYRSYLMRRRPIQPLCLLIWPLVFQLNNTRVPYTGLYAAAQVRYQHTWTYITTEMSDKLAQPYTVSRQNPMLMARLGFQSISPRRIVLDQSLGLGFQFVMARAPREFDPKIVALLNTSGEAGVFPLVNYSFKIGFIR